MGTERSQTLTLLEQESSSLLKGSYYLGKVLGKSRQLWEVTNCEDCPELGGQIVLQASGQFYQAMGSFNWWSLSCMLDSYYPPLCSWAKS